LKRTYYRCKERSCGARYTKSKPLRQKSDKDKDKDKDEDTDEDSDTTKKSGKDKEKGDATGDEGKDAGPSIKFKRIPHNHPKPSNPRIRKEVKGCSC
jgi:hypothetical protein